MLSWTLALRCVLWFQLKPQQWAALRGSVLLKGDKNIPGALLLSVAGPGGKKGGWLLADARLKDMSATSDLCFLGKYLPKVVKLPKKCQFTLPFR